MTKKQLEDLARAAINAYIYLEAETDATDSEAMVEWCVRSLDSWYETAELEAAEVARLLRVDEAAREWERVTTEHVNGSADEVIAVRRAARAELRAALAAMDEVKL